MFDLATAMLTDLSTSLSVEAFTFIGSFVEEVVAPIPSPIVMTIAGSLAHAQGHLFSYLFVLSLIGAAGKTLGALLVYGVSYRMGSIFIDKFGHLFGVKLSDVQQFGQRLNGGWRDIGLVTFLRALPVMSSAVVSVGCGILHIGIWTYLVSTIVGTIIRDFFYLYVGYSGVAAYRAMVEGLDSIEGVMEIAIGIFIVIALGWMYWRRRNG